MEDLKPKEVSWVWVLVLIVSLSGFGCKSDSTGPSSGGAAITGVVKDMNGNPVAGANLNLGLRVRSLVMDTVFAFNPGSIVQFQFGIPARNTVRMEFEDYGHRHVRLRNLDSLNPGTYSVSWDLQDDLGKDVPTDCYYWRVVIGNSAGAWSKALVPTAQHLSNNPLAFIQSDQNGRFAIPLARLPLNEVFRLGGQFPDSVKLDRKQVVFAFTMTRYGTDTVFVDDANEHLIVLSTPK